MALLLFFVTGSPHRGPTPAGGQKGGKRHPDCRLCFGITGNSGWIVMLKQNPHDWRARHRWHLFFHGLPGRLRPGSIPAPRILPRHLLVLTRAARLSNNPTGAALPADTPSVSACTNTVPVISNTVACRRVRIRARLASVGMSCSRYETDRPVGKGGRLPWDRCLRRRTLTLTRNQPHFSRSAMASARFGCWGQERPAPMTLFTPHVPAQRTAT